MDTIWTRDFSGKSYSPLIGEQEREAVVIGGGMAGILIARELEDAGVHCAVLEANRVGSGVTAGTTAVVSAQHAALYQDLVKSFGTERARGYLNANWEAVRAIAERAKSRECDYEERPSLMWSATDGAKMRREAETVQELGFPAVFTDTAPLGLRCAGAVVFPGMGQFHPLKFLRAMAEGLEIYELSAVRKVKVKDMMAYTDGGSVRAKHIVFACHFPFMDRRGLYFMKMHQCRESVVAVENAPALEATMTEDAQGGFFLRNYGDRLLVGCGNHLPGEENDDFARLERFLKKHLPGAREICRWVNQDCFTLDGAPYIGTYSPATPRVFVAAGFNAWGMSTSMAAAKLLTALITGADSPYKDVFSPARKMAAGPLAQNAGRSAVNLLTPTLPRCTHLGCALKQNDSAGTWDCPCHGSRFNRDGSVITGPAVKPLKLK